MSKPDLASLRGALWIIDDVLRMATDNFNRDGHLATAAFLFGTQVDPHTGQPLGKPGFNVIGTQVPFTGDADKDSFVEQLGAVCRRTRCAGVAILAEAWHATCTPTELMSGVRPSTHPRRREVAYLLLEHKRLGGKARVWVADIIRESGQKPRLGKFRSDDEINTTNFGRFGHLLSDN